MNLEKGIPVTAKDVGFMAHLPLREKKVIIKREAEEEQAYKYAEEFLRLWAIPVPESDVNTPAIYERLVQNQTRMAELVNQTYLTEFGKFVVLHDYTEKLLHLDTQTNHPAAQRLGIKLDEERYGGFDISEDLPAIEAELMQPYLPFASEGTDEQKAYMEEWQKTYKERYFPGSDDDNKAKEKRLPHQAIGHWLTKEAYDANATWGHIINIIASAIGTNVFLKLVGQEDVITRIGPAGGLLALALIGSFNLANRGMDPKTEGKALKILTFAPTIALGMLLGMMAKNLEQALAMAPLITVLAASGMSYWYISQMSRNWEFQMLQQAGVFSRYGNLGDLVSRIKTQQNQAVIDKLLKLLTKGENYWLITRTIRSEVAPQVDAEEQMIKATLRDIRKYLGIQAMAETYQF